MRYSDRSGGLSDTERERREALRLRAADMFSGGIRPPRVARLLGVTRKSACEWHRTWQKGGKAALRSKAAPAASSAVAGGGVLRAGVGPVSALGLCPGVGQAGGRFGRSEVPRTFRTRTQVGS